MTHRPPETAGLYLLTPGSCVIDVDFGLVFEYIALPYLSFLKLHSVTLVVVKIIMFLLSMQLVDHVFIKGIN